MTGDFGLSFAPTGQNEAQNRDQAQTPIQDAIKVLSLRIPSFVGAQGVAPNALLQAPGASGMPGGMGVPGGLEEWLRRLLGGDMGQMGVPMGPAPAPHIGAGGGQPVQRGGAVSDKAGGQTGDVGDISGRLTPRTGGIVNPPSIQPSPSPTMPSLGGRRPFQQLP